MKFVEDLLYMLLETIGFETTKFVLGDLFPGAIIGLFPAALVGGVVSDWQCGRRSKLLSAIPWAWFASIVIFVVSLYLWYALILA